MSAIAIRINSNVWNTTLLTNSLLHILNIWVGLFNIILDVHLWHTEIRQTNIVRSFRDIDMIILLIRGICDIAGSCNYILMIPLSYCHLRLLSMIVVHWVHTACCRLVFSMTQHILLREKPVTHRDWLRVFTISPAIRLNFDSFLKRFHLLLKFTYFFETRIFVVVDLYCGLALARTSQNIPFLIDILNAVHTDRV